MEKLMHIFGRGPRLFQDYNPPEEFRGYAVQDLASVLIAKGRQNIIWWLLNMGSMARRE